jgi:hypothetical protein
MQKAFSLREKSEKPLTEIDQLLLGFSSSTKARLLKNYRDYPSRTIYWRKGRCVSYIQIKLNDDTSNYEENVIKYNVFACKYKIWFPLLNFWNMRFDQSSSHCEQIGEIQSPIDLDEVADFLDKALGLLRKK